MESASKWIIFLVAFDDPDVEPQVVAERIAADEDEHIAAFLRGGQVLEVRPGHQDEGEIEYVRREFEKICLR